MRVHFVGYALFPLSPCKSIFDWFGDYTYSRRDSDGPYRPRLLQCHHGYLLIRSYADSVSCTLSKIVEIWGHLARIKTCSSSSKSIKKSNVWVIFRSFLGNLSAIFQSLFGHCSVTFLYVFLDLCYKCLLIFFMRIYL